MDSLKLGSSTEITAKINNMCMGAVLAYAVILELGRL